MATQTRTMPTRPIEVQVNSTDRNVLCLAGIGVTHSIASPMHNFISKAIGRPTWRFHLLECPQVEVMMAIFRAPDFAGGVVTMPYKQAVIPHLDGIDECAEKIGAVNNVYLTPNGGLRGSNTDWCGITGCLLGASEAGRGKPALIIGAGGASRAAIYALNTVLGCNTIYVINRDQQEVVNLFEDVQRHNNDPSLQLVHVTSTAQAQQLSEVFYIVGTVPDFEPTTEAELEVRSILETFLLKGGKTGVLLDMCYKPRNTRILKLGRAHGWAVVDGTGVIGHQIEVQYRLWTGEDMSSKIPKDEAWRLLNHAAEESTAINF